MSRKETREELMKLFYQLDMTDKIEGFNAEEYVKSLEMKVDDKYFIETADNFVNNLTEIDESIEKYSNGWKLNRIAKVDLAILRLAVCEMEYDESIPVSVSINEAVEISKKYSNSDAHKFINGILGNLSRSKDQDS
ncbi:NusB antitermination factor [Dethiosulfatibacter aminovorans DSM 17477]|uniref:Transcription antitermination protein NusB n=1 Tax=Dethiosulfatibacter aminovorans DSM 17477 TaxID=1121476 RepID=A0A1M6D9L3_9FIRM|nr:transcription antitermination factor NusB [Dethiosulfatibacter aminovorans]SHI69678.1 NusB antitermination factor [Dethiosulfatibacter aminovorans DSM 17477]